MVEEKFAGLTHAEAAEMERRLKEYKKERAVAVDEKVRRKRNAETIAKSMEIAAEQEKNFLAGQEANKQPGFFARMGYQFKHFSLFDPNKKSEPVAKLPDTVPATPIKITADDIAHAYSEAMKRVVDVTFGLPIIPCYYPTLGMIDIDDIQSIIDGFAKITQENCPCFKGAEISFTTKYKVNKTPTRELIITPQNLKLCPHVSDKYKDNPAAACYHSFISGKCTNPLMREVLGAAVEKRFYAPLNNQHTK